MSMRKQAIACALIWAGCAMANAQQAPAKPIARPLANRDEVVSEFEARVNQYLELRKDKAGTSPRQTTSAEKLADSQKQMAEKVKAARPAAKQGDIFTPKIAEYFRRQIAFEMQGRDGAKISASLRHAEPVKGLSLRVNSTYPDSVPVQSMPASLLLNLPGLPKELEYRIVGRDLVLHDIASNTVVDFVPNALPAAK